MISISNIFLVLELSLPSSERREKRVRKSSPPLMALLKLIKFIKSTDCLKIV